MKRLLTLALLMTGTSPLLHAAPGQLTDILPTDTTKVVDIEEVVVIATPKETNRLRQTSVSATLFAKDQLRSDAVSSVKSLSGLVPNLFIPDYGSKLTTSLYVRGIGSRINTPAVGLYVDNIPYVDKSAFDFNYYDIERIDVMRGPQGTLYGRNTMGGLIRIFTKNPFSYQGTDLSLTAASYNNYKISVGQYHRLSEKFAFSANLFYEHKGGFYKNEARNNDRIDYDDEFGGRLRAIYLPHENLKVDLTLNYEYTKQGGYPYYYTGRTEDKEEDRADYIGKISYNSESGYKRNLLNAGMNIEHQADRFILNSVTGFQYLYDQMNLDQDFTEVNLYTMQQKQNSKMLTQEIVLKSKPGSRWQWTTGVSGFYQWLHTEAPVTFQNDGVAWMNDMANTMANRFMPAISQGPMTMHFQFQDNINGTSLPIDGNFDSPILNTALFHQTTVNDLFGLEGLSFTAGLRMDYEKLTLHYDTGCDYSHTYSLSGKLTPANKVIPMILPTTFEKSIRYQGKLKHDYIQLLPKFALQYNFNAQNNLYATVSKGYRSGGYNFQMFSDLMQNDLRSGNMKDVADVTIPVIESVGMISPDIKDKVIGMLQSMSKAPETDVRAATLYKPEYSWNYEIGSHLTLFDGKLQADLAGFLMDTHDQQISQFSKSGLGRVTVNAGKSRSIGGEVGIRSQLTDAFSLTANYGYTYATFTDYELGHNTDYDGNYVPFVPKHTFNVGGQYVFTLRGSWLDNVTLNAHYSGAGRIYWTEKNDVSQDVYGTLNGRVSLNKGKGQIGFWIKNALNKEYQAFYFETMSRGFAQQGRPMQFGVDVRCSF